MALTQVQQSLFPPQVKAFQQDNSLTIRLPEMFVLFLSGEPTVNPHYESVRKVSEEWLVRECSFNEKAQRRLHKTDFAYFCAIAVPDAEPEELRTVFDWGNWVFPFDDLFDNGCLKDDPHRAEALIDSLKAGMVDQGEYMPVSADHPLVQIHNSVWHRIAKASSVGIRRRFATTMRDYCTGCIAQVRKCSEGKLPSLEEMLSLRRQSAGVSPLFSLVEYAHKLELPDCVFECKSIREIERIGIDLVLIQNDILSYCKEEKEGVRHNMVAICRHNGMPAQMAFNHIGSMLAERYRDWYLALAALPTWGEPVDADVQKYIRGVQNVVRANLHWSFRSGRYFGPANDKVRRTGQVTVRGQSADFKLSFM
ncbi:pentalenene synthase [Aspergillus heteromorphus CBS 117.55]|uniref:Terpene synthase n=1 Tax=Aspergillus heteromorphus CBS 117.55 TaxID=1448321 RepID=A0A317VMI5_9EURO|nr:pentalenene synthase [Aspergillus heteromorphus CBS 117.55]PWY75125.1 pentalenene synthase [Aspergillus heteromorphus CBS 117.55]